VVVTELHGDLSGFSGLWKEEGEAGWLSSGEVREGGG